MKFILTTLSILILLTPDIYAQKLRKKTVEKGNVKEVYYIDKESKMMNGDYFKIVRNTKDTLIFGHFKNAMRTGIWVFNDFKTKARQLEYNFSNDSLLFLDREAYPDSFLVKQKDQFVYGKVDRPLIFIGYKDEEKHILGSDLEIPSSILKNNLIGTSIIRFTVNETGNLSGSSIIASFNETLEHQINALINSLDGRFLPAIADGAPVLSMFYVKINVLSGFNFNLELPNKYPYIYDLNLVINSITKTRRIQKVVYSKEFFSVPNLLNR